MKKTIKILSVIVIIVFAVTPILNNLYAAVFINRYSNLIETDAVIKLKAVVLSNIMPIINAAFNIWACVYLIKHSCEGVRYISEIVILSIRVVVLPFIGSVYSSILSSFLSTFGVESFAYYSAYANLTNCCAFIQSIAGSLFIIAFSFSASAKVNHKKQSLNVTTEMDS